MLDHHQLMAQCPDHRQVMADEQVSEVVFLLQITQQLDHLALHRAVQRRGRLIQQNQRRLEHQRPGDGNALALPTRKLMRVAVPGARVEPYLLQRRNDGRLLLLSIADTVNAQALPNDVCHAHARAEAAEGVLEHHLHLAP